MKILIIENEVYLAQSIATKLGEKGHACEMCTSTKDAIKGSDYDIVLLSTSINGQDFHPVIETFKNSIIILMVSYISNDTVSRPLSAGAKDYILKPFMIEELLRKIEHYQEYQELKKENNLYKEYICSMLNQIKVDFDIDKLSSCTVIETNYPKAIDKLIFEYAKKHKKHLSIISVRNENWQDKITNFNNELLYIIDVHTLKKTDKEQLLKLILDKEFIICTTTAFECDFDTITITIESKLYDHNEILTIDEYVKYVVNNFQYKFPDTELSKKLGISRKSLWEKRKKYGLFKNK